jgi:hypothetical protein
MKQKLLLISLLIAFSCNDQTQELPTKLDLDNALIAEAQRDFETTDFIAKSNPLARRGNGRKSLAKAALWAKATTKRLSFGGVVIVPISFEGNIQAGNPEDPKRYDINNITYLLSYKDANKKLHHEILTTVPDGKSTEDNFTGLITIEDWHGNFLRSYLYTDSTIQKMGESMITQPNAKYAQTICTTTDWYTCSSSIYGTFCSYNYSETTCTAVDVQGGTEGSGSGGPTPSDYGNTGAPKGNGGVVSATTSSYELLNPDQTVGKLCDNLAFLQVGNSYTAEITGLGVSAVNANLNKFINSELGTCCVQIPNYELKDRFEASTAFTIAYNTARAAIPRFLNAGSLSPDAISIRAKLKSLILNILNENYPGSSFSTQSCSGNVPKNIADYGC